MLFLIWLHKIFNFFSVLCKTEDRRNLKDKRLEIVSWNSLYQYPYMFFQYSIQICSLKIKNFARASVWFSSYNNLIFLR